MTSGEVIKALHKSISGREVFVDAAKGRDDGDGMLKSPYKTIDRAAKVAGPGDTVTSPCLETRYG